MFNNDRSTGNKYNKFFLNGGLSKTVGLYGPDILLDLYDGYLSDLAEIIKIKEAQAQKEREKEKPEDKQPPTVPPKKAMTDKEKAAELDRILQEHGIEPKDASAEQKDFYGQFIDKSPAEIAKAVADIVKDAKDMDPRVAEEMGLMTAILEGADSTILDKMLDEIQPDGGLPYEMMATEHIVAIADMVQSINGKDLKGIKIPPKMDITPKDPKDIGTLTAMFAFEQLMSKVNAKDLVALGLDMSSITSATKSIEVACRDRAKELGIELTKPGSAPIRSTISVLKEALEKDSVKEDKEAEAVAEHTAEHEPEEKSKYVPLTTKMMNGLLKNNDSAKNLDYYMDSFHLSPQDKQKVLEAWLEGAGLPNAKKGSDRLERRYKEAEEMGLIDKIDAEIKAIEVDKEAEASESVAESSEPTADNDGKDSVETEIVEVAPALSVEELEDIATDPNRSQEEQAKAMEELNKINNSMPVQPQQSPQNGASQPGQSPVMEDDGRDM